MDKKGFINVAAAIMGIMVVAAGIYFSQWGVGNSLMHISSFNKASETLSGRVDSVAANVTPTHQAINLNSGKRADAQTPLASPLTRTIDMEYAENFSNDRILVGASHNIFVGKIINQVGIRSRGFGLETQFSVSVVSNIKGNLQGIVTVDQFGGYAKDGALYVVEDGASLLLPGSTYLLSTRYNSNENFYTLNSFPTASKIISQDNALSDAQLQALVMSDMRVWQLKSAYPREILLNADLENNNARNNYQSFLASQLASTTATNPPH